LAQTQYLKWRGTGRSGRWWLKLPIPRPIRPLYLSANGKPRTHIEETLGTADLREANRKKHGRIGYWLEEFRFKAQAANGTLPSNIGSADEFRRMLREAADDGEADAIKDMIADKARTIYEEGLGAVEDERGVDPVERARAYSQAKDFYKLASAKATLREAWDKWQQVRRISPRAKLKDAQAFRELLAFLGVTDEHPDAITPAKARAYVRWLNTEAQSARGGGPLSKSSKEGRLWPLRAFWSEYLIHNELAEVNPWLDHKLLAGNEGAAKKRPYTDAEIMALIDGPERVSRKDVRYPKRTILEVYAMGFYTGARREEIAGRLLGDFEKIKGGYIMHIRKSKTEAGARSIPIYHPIPVSIIARRIGKRTDPKAQLFEEFTRSGPDKTLGENIGKSMGHYRDAVGITGEADFHSTRRQLITNLVAQGHSKELVQFYVGHKVPGVTGIYAKPTDEGMRKIAKAIKYPAKIERALAAALA
jgi:site-specific recombinase XerD